MTVYVVVRVCDEVSCGFQVCNNKEGFACIVVQLDPNDGYRKVVYS